jgi:hypothetical protein
VRALTREIAGTNANADLQELAYRVAEARIDLRLIRHARHRAFDEARDDPMIAIISATTYSCLAERSQNAQLFQLNDIVFRCSTAV